MLELIARRMAIGAVALFTTSLVFFVGAELVPGDYATELARMRAQIGERVDFDNIEIVREALGLYRPLHVRYFEWLNDVLHGDFGKSWANRAEVSELIAKRLPNTLFLALVTSLIAVPLSVGLGIFAAAKQGSRADRLVTVFSLSALSIPEFVMAYLLVFVLAVTLPIFPAVAVNVDSMSFMERLHAIALPVLTLTLTMMASMARLTRATVINVLSREFIEMARLKGLSAYRILMHHAMPHAIAPIINITILAVANLVVGTFVVEFVFAYPGIGQLMLEAVKLQHMPVVQACGLIFATTYILLVLIADIVSIVANPLVAERELPAFKRAHRRLRQIKYEHGMRVATIAAGLMLLVAVPLLAHHYGQRGIEVADFDRSARAPDDLLERTELTLKQLFSKAEEIVTPVHNAYFGAVDGSLPARHVLNGSLFIEKMELMGQRPQQLRVQRFGAVPAYEAEFFTHDGHLVPTQRDIVRLGVDGDWDVLLSPGRVWSEPQDEGFSRASFPFTLVSPKWSLTRNGLATFVYTDQSVSNLRFQIVQESAPGGQWDAAGQVGLAFISRPARQYECHRRKFQQELDDWSDVRPYDSLKDRYDGWALSVFDGRFNRRNITVSGVIIDGVVYSSPCRTRFGNYPYCRHMYHGVYSISKSLGALVSMLRLAEKYGERVFDLRIRDFVPLETGHGGWQHVTFGDALNMATGVGDAEPDKVEYYVDSDRTRTAARVHDSMSVREKLSAIGDLPNYAWGPGEVFRYSTSDTFVLAVAMDRFLKQQEGPDVHLWDVVSEEVLAPIGIRHLPMVHTREADDSRGVPLLGDGMLLTVDHLAKLIELLRNHGRHNDIQILNEKALRNALRASDTTGLATGWNNEEGEDRYHMSLWLIPYRAHFGCSVWVPAMSGYGGNYVLLMPNGITAFRFADGRASNPGTWDSSWLRYVTDYMRPLCR